MKPKYLFSSIICLISLSNSFGQTTFRIFPLINGVTNIKDGLLEAGAEIKSNSISIKHFFRTPLTDKDNELVKIDRFTSTWRFVAAIEYIIDKTQPTGPINRIKISLQGEYGWNRFTFYPDANTTKQEKSTDSYGGEIKLNWYHSMGQPNARQISTQIRIRYDYNWKAAKEIGVVQAPDTNGISIIKNMIINAPSVFPIFSPAIAVPIYGGSGDFFYAPAIYWDNSGKANTNNPFAGVSRLKFENWTFFCPNGTGTVNVRIGASPFLSLRIQGQDDFRTLEWGGLLTLKIGTTMLQFF